METTRATFQGNRSKSYFARRIWHGPNDTCWHVWLAPAPRHIFHTDPRPICLRLPDRSRMLTSV